MEVLVDELLLLVLNPDYDPIVHHPIQVDRKKHRNVKFSLHEKTKRQTYCLTLNFEALRLCHARKHRHP